MKKKAKSNRTEAVAKKSTAKGVLTANARPELLERKSEPSEISLRRRPGNWWRLLPTCVAC